MGKNDPSFPGLDQHVAIAGMTGSGKTTAAIDMLSRRMSIPWLLIDFKRDTTIAKLPVDRLAVTARILPDAPGIYHITPEWTAKAAADLNDLLERVFLRRGKRPARTGVFIDEGHLAERWGELPMIETILVAGRDKIMPMMYLSQRAQGINPFIWSQSTFFRSFRLQTINDKKRFNDNFLEPYFEPDDWHSHYFDGNKARQFYLAPSDPLPMSINRIDVATTKRYKAI